MIKATIKTWERLKLERRNLDRVRYADWFEHFQVARLVQADYLDRIDYALTRRLMSAYGDPNDCFESFVRELGELADKWQEILDADDNGRTRLKSDLNHRRKASKQKANRLLSWPR